MEIKENQPKSINWEMFPKETVPALKGLLEELEVSTIDRDPDQTERLRMNVTNKLGELSNQNMSGIAAPRKLSNREISTYFDSCAVDVGRKKDVELSAIYKSVSYMAKAFERSRSPKAK